MCAHRPSGKPSNDDEVGEEKARDQDESIRESENQKIDEETSAVLRGALSVHIDFNGASPEGDTDHQIGNIPTEESANEKVKFQWPSTNELETLSREAKKRKLRHYYLHQLEMMKNFEADYEFVEKFAQDEEEAKRGQGEERVRKSDDILTKISLMINIIILAGMITAAAISGSLVVLGNVVDSAMDTIVSTMIFLANRAIKKRNSYKYPRGRTRLEPIAILIVSVIMGAASIQVISKSLESITSHNLHLKLDVITIVIMSATIVTKFSLMVLCCMFRSPNTVVLAQDHGNDCLSNVVALICVFVANRYWIYLDPIGAIAVSIYILISWIRIGSKHVKILSGRTARPEFINRIVKICLDHQPEVKKVDTVLVYHYGTKYLVEVHIVLDAMVSLKEAHDISEPLQRKIEYLPHVERAYVHIDYETDHRPDYEHKVV